MEAGTYKSVAAKEKDTNAATGRSSVVVESGQRWSLTCWVRSVATEAATKAARDRVGDPQSPPVSRLEDSTYEDRGPRARSFRDHSGSGMARGETFRLEVCRASSVERVRRSGYVRGKSKGETKVKSRKRARWKRLNVTIRGWIGSVTFAKASLGGETTASRGAIRRSLQGNKSVS